MRHIILGMGGIGGLLGATLVRAGFDAAYVGRPPAVSAYDGITRLESEVFGEMTAPVLAVTSLGELSAPLTGADVLWVTVKATGLESALAAASADDVGDALVIPLLNGVDHLEVLRSRYPRVAAGVIRVEAERVAPGHIRQSSPFARVEVGETVAPAPERLGVSPAEVAGMLTVAGFAASTRPDEAGMLWDKLVFLGPAALATTAFAAPLGEVRDLPELVGAQAEAVAVARAEGAAPDVESLRAMVAGAPAGMRSSMQKDVEAGRTPELDAIAGPILRGGARHGIAVPHVAALVERIEARLG